MNDNGWIKLHRSILKWEWWDDCNVRSLFIYCLLMANHTEKQWHGSTVPRGSFVTSLPELSKGTGLSIQQVRTAISKLKSTDEITDQSTREYRVITINNYTNYQCDDDTEQQTNQQTNQQTQQQTNNRQITDEQQTNNSNQECKNIINNFSSLRSEKSLSDFSSDDEFELSEEKNSEGEKEKINYDKLAAYWNETTGGRFGIIRTIENQRRQMVRARVRQYGKEKLVEAINKAVQSEFISNSSWFNFDWLIRPNNFDKVIAGNFDNRQQTTTPNNGTQQHGTGTVTKPLNDDFRTDF